jgi:homocysteine S-methyltransferase
MTNASAKYRACLPQFSNQLFLTDGGLETTLIFHDGIDLPHFASFDLLKNAEGTEHIRRYYAPTPSSRAMPASALCWRA